MTSLLHSLIRPAIVVAAIACLPIVLTADSGFQVVVHSGNPTASLPCLEVSRIFLKKGLQRPGLWGAGPGPVPIDLNEDWPAREAFSKTVHGRTMKAILTYWQRNIFSGRSAPPPEAGTLDEVYEHISRNPGGIGYVPADAALPDSVKVLEVTPCGTTPTSTPSP